MAEYFAMAFRAVPKKNIIGSTTAGIDGNVFLCIFVPKINRIQDDKEGMKYWKKQ
ncbi:MAG TPA: hypothetical protein PKX15_07325 [Bacteroidales bacterium]|nr:hypothetical protein [Bacteroidales bacterium]